MSQLFDKSLACRFLFCRRVSETPPALARDSPLPFLPVCLMLSESPGLCVSEFASDPCQGRDMQWIRGVVCVLYCAPPLRLPPWVLRRDEGRLYFSVGNAAFLSAAAIFGDSPPGIPIRPTGWLRAHINRHPCPRVGKGGSLLLSHRQATKSAWWAPPPLRTD